MEMYRKAVEWAEDGRRIALGTVISAQGSTPQKAGSKALVDDSGGVWGTLGGGLVEARGLQQMAGAIESTSARLLEIKLDESYSREAGPICGGVMRIFANPGGDAKVQAYRAALQAWDRREKGLLVTLVKGPEVDVGTVRWIPESDCANGAGFPSREALARALESEEPICVADADREAYIERVAAPPRLLVVGGGHVGQAVVRQAALLGFEVTLVDDREEFAQPALFPGAAKTVHGNLGELVAAFPQDSETFIILVSKGHRPDAEALEGCIHGGAKYIGMIGSKRKVRELKKHFLEDGLASEEEWSRIVAPIGFDLGAVTVPEIGVAIAAQLIAARRLGRTDSRSMSLNA